MDCNKTDCIHYKVCEEWKSLGNDNYINESNGNCDCYSSPYNSSGDCISREALKEAIEQGEGIPWDRYGKDALCVRKKYIDNAPTVDLWQMRQEATENALKKAEVLYNRPQGEWEKDNIGIYCSVCKCHIDVESPFCPLCGADMRGGAE